MSDKTYTSNDFKAALDAENTIKHLRCGYCDEEHYGPIIRFCLQAMADDGWKMVPKEPDKSMMLNGSTCYHHEWNDLSCTHRETRKLMYGRMLSAAPAYEVKS